jgi:hypothetical protein
MFSKVKFKSAGILCIAIAGCITSSCILPSLTSTTLIQPQKSFMLGQGNHGPYKAYVQNGKKDTITIYQRLINGDTIGVVKLQPNGNIVLKVARDTQAIFENASSKTISIKIKLYGDTNLSMNYENIKNP